ncbi:hypothetical protein G3A40_37430 [Paraburkholderia aspalathi]|uniref:hypothetical protein n=1 Tax=Paraburkholderia aspalathi TaxID=1324617 RepID=UPI00190C2513|nr:hypothetical protein [Paraburkholderia aspalathi]MBK3865429.1 hypothetical protein [Paraburkholderia aspalathi]
MKFKPLHAFNCLVLGVICVRVHAQGIPMDSTCFDFLRATETAAYECQRFQNSPSALTKCMDENIEAQKKTCAPVLDGATANSAKKEN